MAVSTRQSEYFDYMMQGVNIRTPSGLLVNESGLDALVKAEVRRRRDDGVGMPPMLPPEIVKAQSRVLREGKGKYFSQFRYTYPVTGSGQDKPYASPSFSVLREAGRKSPIDAIILQARFAQMKQVAQPSPGPDHIGFEVVHRHYKRPGFKLTPQIERRCRMAKDWLSHPDPEVHPTFRDFAVKSIREELVIDRKVMEIIPGRGGEPAAFRLIPGDTIKPRLLLLEKEMRRQGLPSEKPNYDRIIESIYRDTGVDLTNAAYVQEIDGTLVTAFTKDELSVDIQNPTTELDRLLWGESCLEISLDVTLGFIRAWQINRDYFAKDTPDQVLAVIGDYDPQGLEAFKQQIRAEAGGAQNYWRTAIISSMAGEKELELKAIKLRNTPQEMMWGDFLRMCINLKCFKYDVTVTTDRGPMWIGKVASQRLPVKIKSVDLKTGRQVFAQVTDWQVSKSEDWIRLWYPVGKRRRSIEVTADHEIWTDQGMVQARKLVSGDVVYVASPGMEDSIVPVRLTGVEKLEFKKPRPCYDVTVEPTHTIIAHQLVTSNCAAYRADTSILNFSPDMGSGRPMIVSNTREEIIETSKEEGFNSCLNAQTSWLTRALLEKRSEFNDLMMIYVGLDVKDEKDRIDIVTKKADAFITIDEARKEDNRPPLPNGQGKVIGVETYRAEMNRQHEKEMASAGSTGEEGGPLEEGPEKTLASLMEKPGKKGGK